MIKMYHITMPDESIWEVPVVLIAVNHAEYYATVDEISFEESFKNTSKLFEDDEDEVEEWAKNNMDWNDVESSARRVSDPGRLDFQEGWTNGYAEVV